MLSSRLHLVLILSLLMLSAASFSGSPGAAFVSVLDKSAATRPEPIEVEPIGSVSSDEVSPSW